jgi:hypothetical protein
VFSNEVGVFCQCHGTVWEIKKVDERFVISRQHKKTNVVIIASPAWAYLVKQYNRSLGRLSKG